MYTYMKKSLVRAFWVFSTIYGRIFARPWLAGFHQILLNLSLHGLGYDNSAGYDATGERWFMHSVLNKKADIKIAFDIGANIGKYSTDLINTLNCEVYAFEPAPETFTHLENTARQFPSLHPVHSAISDFDGTAILFSDIGHSENASLAAEAMYNPDTSEGVPVCTIDTFVSKRPIERIDFIKIDTEGFEREVLRGMQDTLRTFKPRYIQFEFNVLQLYRGYTLREITHLLPEYTFYRLLPHGWIPVNPDRFRDNIFMYCNIVAVRIPS